MGWRKMILMGLEEDAGVEEDARQGQNIRSGERC